MTSVSTVIQHHKSRAEHLEKMLTRLGSNYGDIQVVTDPGDNGPWHTAKIAWATSPTTHSHRLVLQDDVIFCQDFLAGVTRLARRRPGAVIGLYAQFGGKKLEEAIRAGEHWAQIPGKLAGPALLMPTKWALAFVRWHDAWLPPYSDASFWSDKMGCDTEKKLATAKTCWADWRVRMFAQHHRLPIWFTVPSLVDHIGWNTSINGHNNKRKRAKFFLGEDKSALSVNWATRPRELNKGT